MATRPPAVDSEWEDVTDEWETIASSVADTETTPASKSATPTTESGYTNPVARFASGAGKAIGAVFNPMEYVRAAKALGSLAVGSYVHPIDTTRELASIPGALAKRATESPEGAGEVAGNVASAFIPVGGAAGAILRKLGITRAARARTILRAIRGKKDVLGLRIPEAESEIDLPVSLTHRQLAEKLIDRKVATGEAVGRAEAALPAGDIPIDDIISRIPEPKGTMAVTHQRVKGVLTPVSEFVPDDQAAYAAYKASLAQLDRAGGDVAAIPTGRAVEMKRSFQGQAARGRAYEKTAGEEAAVGTEAARERAEAVQAALEDLPGPEAEEFARANRAASVARMLEAPATKEMRRIERLAPLTRGTEILLGRAGAAGRGGPIGAIAGLAGGQILDSPLYLTASAALKKQAIRALESGNLQQAVDILVRGAIANRARNTAAQRELRRQAEGVVEP